MSAKAEDKTEAHRREVKVTPEASRNMVSLTPPAVVNRETLSMPRVRPGAPVAELIQAALKSAVARVQAADPEARRGEPEGIHRLRTSTRRLRSELRAVEGLVDCCWHQRLEAELKWLTGLLGSVRDLDILRQRLHEAIHELPSSSNDCEPSLDETLRPLFQAIDDRHATNARALREALQADRYRQIVTALESSAEHPALKDEAWEPCRTALPPLAAAAWRRLKKRACELDESDPDAEFHEVRKRAKRARYAAELIAPALARRIDKDAERFIRLTTRVQDVLGEHQDAIVASTEIEKFLDEHPQDQEVIVAAAKLLETQRRAADRARDKFFDVWTKLDRAKSLRWFKTKARA
jgi:CHAD domain-containing protein